MTTDGMPRDVAIQEVELARIKPSPLNPRREFDQESIRTLAASIERDDLLQNLVIRPIEDEEYDYEVVCGHRRLEALLFLGRTKAMCAIRRLEDDETILLMLHENDEREGLNPVERAEGYQSLLDRGYTRIQVAEAVGLSQGTISNRLKILNLVEEIRDRVLNGQMNVTRGYIYAKFPPEDQMAAYEESKKVATADLEYFVEMRLGRTEQEAFDMPEDVDVEELAEDLNDGQTTLDAEGDVRLGLERLGRRLGKFNSSLRREATHLGKHQDHLALLFWMKRETLIGTLEDMEELLYELLGVVRHIRSGKLELRLQEQKDGEAA